VRKVKLPDGFRFIDLTPGDLTAVQVLLRSNDLPFEDCSDHLSSFIGIEQNNQLVAIGGFEHLGHYALLRSVAVDSRYRGLKLGSRLVNKIIDQLHGLEVESVYILTETAEHYFTPFNFHAVDRETLPAEIQSTQQCQSLCPASAIAMRLKLIRGQ
jgi:amino-acid N-acetyltransferase